MSKRAAQTIQPGDLVCVTGASGYVGSHVVAQLLAGGYRVRGTVRDADDADKTSHLRALPGADERLELVSADLMKPGAFDAAMADCPYVCHVAASVRLRADDPQAKIVDPAVKGTKNVLASIDRAGVARRVVMTSSIAAVADERKPLAYAHTEDDWNESPTVEDNPYPLAKVLSERAAWAHHEALDDDARWGLVTINPTLVLGPVMSKVHGRSSPALIRDLMNGKFPLIPKFYFNMVDVRDVADAHVLALQNADAKGRHILNNRGAWLMELAAIARQAYPDRKTPRRTMPNPLMYAVALFDKRLTWGFLRRNLGAERRMNNRKSIEALGVQYHSVEDTIRATAKSFVDLEIV